MSIIMDLLDIVALCAVGTGAAFLAIDWVCTTRNRRHRRRRRHQPLERPLTSCYHREAVEVHASYSAAAIEIYGPPAETLVAWYCPDCDEQMDAGFRPPAGIDAVARGCLDVRREPVNRIVDARPTHRVVLDEVPKAEIHTWGAEKPIRTIGYHVEELPNEVTIDRSWAVAAAQVADEVAYEARRRAIPPF